MITRKLALGFALGSLALLTAGAARAQSHVESVDPSLGAPSVSSEESHIGGLTGHAAPGKALYRRYCIGCHGPNAEGIHTFPRLAGQHRDYLAIQLQQFNGRRHNGQLRESEIMHRFTQDITEDEIAAVTEYLASK